MDVPHVPPNVLFSAFVGRLRKKMIMSHTSTEKLTCMLKWLMRNFIKKLGPEKILKIIKNF